MDFDIRWVRPDPEKVVYDFFNDDEKTALLSNQKLTFTEDTLKEFIKKGSFETLKVTDLLNNSAGMYLEDQEIEDALKDNQIADKLFKNIEELETRGSLTLPSSTLVKIDKKYYSIGNLNYMLAFRYEGPVKMWVIDASEYKPIDSETVEDIEGDIMPAKMRAKETFSFDPEMVDEDLVKEYNLTPVTVEKGTVVTIDPTPYAYLLTLDDGDVIAYEESSDLHDLWEKVNDDDDVDVDVEGAIGEDLDEIKKDLTTVGLADYIKPLDSIIMGQLIKDGVYEKAEALSNQLTDLYWEIVEIDEAIAKHNMFFKNAIGFKFIPAHKYADTLNKIRNKLDSNIKLIKTQQRLWKTKKD